MGIILHLLSRFRASYIRIRKRVFGYHNAFNRVVQCASPTSALSGPREAFRKHFQDDRSKKPHIPKGYHFSRMFCFFSPEARLISQSCNNNPGRMIVKWVMPPAVHDGEWHTSSCHLRAALSIRIKKTYDSGSQKGLAARTDMGVINPILSILFTSQTW